MFVARNRIAVLVRGQNKIAIKNVQNEVTKVVPIADGARDLFFCGVGRVLVGSEDRVSLLDVQMKKVSKAEKREGLCFGILRFLSLFLSLSPFFSILSRELSPLSFIIFLFFFIFLIPPSSSRSLPSCLSQE